MAKDNFFKLKFHDSSIIRFNDDLVRSQTMYKESYDVLVQFEKEDSDVGNSGAYERTYRYYRKLNHNLCSMKEALNNLVYSYHAFRVIASINEDVRKEFLKLPKDFNGMRSEMMQLLHNYEMCIQQLQTLMEQIHPGDGG